MCPDGRALKLPCSKTNCSVPLHFCLRDHTIKHNLDLQVWRPDDQSPPSGAHDKYDPFVLLTMAPPPPPRTWSLCSQNPLLLSIQQGLQTPLPVYTPSPRLIPSVSNRVLHEAMVPQHKEASEQGHVSLRYTLYHQETLHVKNINTLPTYSQLRD